MKNIEFINGQKMPNDIIFIKEIPSHQFYRRYGLFKCYCGKEFKCLIYSIYTGRTKSCKCLSGKFKRSLGDDDVLDIKRMLKINIFTLNEIADKHKVSTTNVFYIKVGKIHKGITI